MRDELEAMGPSSGGAAHLAAHGERNDATSEQLELILILCAISCANFGWYLPVRGDSALMAASYCRIKNAFYCLERDSSKAAMILELTWSMESCFARTFVRVEDAMTVIRRKEYYKRCQYFPAERQTEESGLV